MHRTIYLAGGCFWGVDHYMGLLKGVVSTECGYAQSVIPNPSYELVCTGTTHAVETVRVIYDDEQIALSFLLEQFFLIIDPTLLNRQGHDIGTQYRTGVYYTDPADETIVTAALNRLQEQYADPICVENDDLRSYYSAELYHQDYLINNPQYYCHIDIAHFAQVQKVVCPTVLIKQEQTLRKK